MILNILRFKGLVIIRTFFRPWNYRRSLTHPNQYSEKIIVVFMDLIKFVNGNFIGTSFIRAIPFGILFGLYFVSFFTFSGGLVNELVSMPFRV